MIRQTLENFIHLMNSKYHWWPVFIQTILLFLFFVYRGGLIYTQNIGGDEPSYVLFNFSSLNEILGSHRTLGYPLILELFQFFFNPFFNIAFRFLPYFQMLIYFISILFLYWSFIKFGFNRILSLIIVSLLIWDSSVWKYFSYVLTESITASFLNFVLGSLFISIRHPNWKSFLLLSFFTFFLYQIRPALVFITVLIPIWAVIILKIFYNLKSTALIKKASQFSAITLIPLFLFCLFRFSIVGNFGVVSFSGVTLSGHASHYLNKGHLEYLSKENKLLAQEILERKKMLQIPINNFVDFSDIIPNREQYQLEKKYHIFNLMITWLVAIKHHLGLEPFDEPDKNLAPWEQGTISGFFSIYNVNIDRQLMDFSKIIITHNWQQYLAWIIGGCVYGTFDYFKQIITNKFFIFFPFILLFSIFILMLKKINNHILKQWPKTILILSMIGTSLFTFGTLITIIFTVPDNRYFGLLSLYLWPSILFLVLLPLIIRE